VQTLPLLASQRRLEGEIKLGEAFDGREPTRAHRRLQAPIVAELNLGAEQLLDGLRRG